MSGQIVTREQLISQTSGVSNIEMVFCRELRTCRAGTMTEQELTASAGARRISGCTATPCWHWLRAEWTSNS